MAKDRWIGAYSIFLTFSGETQLSKKEEEEEEHLDFCFAALLTF
jgi:hypothetical protein